MTRVSVIIATRNRPRDLEELLKSVGVQTRRPDQVLVIDASDNQETSMLVGWFSRETGLTIRYCRAKRASLPAQRNQAIGMLQDGIAVFLDDDVVLDPSYLEVVEGFMAKRSETAIGGLQGVASKAPHPKPQHAWSALGANLNTAIFWVFGLPREARRQQVLSTGGYTYVAGPPSADLEVEFISGYNMCFPVSIFKEGARFDEDYGIYGGWAYMEDVDFSYRLWSKLRRTNYILANARLVHHHSPIARLRDLDLYRLRVVNRFLFWRKNIRFSTATSAAFLWSNLGLLVWGIRYLIRSGNPRVCLGVLSGWVCIVRCQIKRNDLLPSSQKVPN